MQSFKITDLQNAGYNSDISPELLPANALTTVNNAHFLANRLYAIGGYEDLGEVPSLFDPGHVRFVQGASEAYWVIFGAGVENSPSADDKAIYTYSGGTFVDVSVSTAIYDNLLAPNEWTSCLFSNLVVATHNQSYPQVQLTADSTADFTEIFWDGATTWQAEGMSCGAIASHKNFLFAMNMTEGGTELPYVVRWSDAADVGAMPSTWDETVPTNLAGKVALAAEGGKCLNGLSLRDSFIVYRESSVHAFDFVGGQYVFNQRMIASGIGALGRHSFCEYNNMHYFMSAGDIYETDGNSFSSILTNKARLLLIGTMNQKYAFRSFVFTVPVLGEIWFCFPSGSELVNSAIVYNVESKAITTVDLAPTYHAGAGFPSSSDKTWNDLVESWDNTFGSWYVSSAGKAISQAYFCTVEDGATKSRLGSINTVGFSTSSDFETVFERASLPLTEDYESSTILEVYPHHSASSDIYFTIGTQNTPFDAIDWHDEQTVASGQRKIDVRATGKYFSYRFRSLGKEAWYLSGLTIRFEHDGLR